MNQQTLYSPAFEHDSCGIGGVVNIKGERNHQCVSDALSIVEKLEHRAGKDATGETGDGVGIILQVPTRFLNKAIVEEGLVDAECATEYALGDLGVGMFFFPQDQLKRQLLMHRLEPICERGDISFVR